MRYDHDLARARRWAALLALLNLTVTILNMGNWAVMTASLVWLLCCWLWRRIIDAQQATRDRGRVIEAGLHATRRQYETGQY